MTVTVPAAVPVLLRYELPVKDVKENAAGDPRDAFPDAPKTYEKFIGWLPPAEASELAMRAAPALSAVRQRIERATDMAFSLGR